MAEDKDRDDHHNGNDNHDDQSDVAHGSGVPAPSPAQDGSILGKPTAGMANTVAGLAAAFVRCWNLCGKTSASDLAKYPPAGRSPHGRGSACGMVHNGSCSAGLWVGPVGVLSVSPRPRRTLTQGQPARPGSACAASVLALCLFPPHRLSQPRRDLPAFVLASHTAGTPAASQKSHRVETCSEGPPTGYRVSVAGVR